MTLRKAEKHLHYPHLIDVDTWERNNRSMFGRDDSLEELMDEYDVDEAKPETLIGELADDHEDEFVVWHDYEHQETQVFKLK